MCRRSAKGQPQGQKLRKAIRQQLGYVRRNLGHIDSLVFAGALLTELRKHLYRSLLVVSEVFRQQQYIPALFVERD
ncbi:MAG: hypothetical protein ACK6BS_20915 [Pseudanabaena sp.]|jgi:hypothetical protein